MSNVPAPASSGKHTPGPWLTSEYGQYLGGKPGKTTIAAVNPARIVAENVNPEDGPLIAAAPDLQAAIDLACLILHRDGIAPLEGQAFTQPEREQIESLASAEVLDVLADE